MRFSVFTTCLSVIALSGFSGCGETEEASPTVTAPIDDGTVYACRYQNPFSKVDECRQYYGGWSPSAVDEACETVFTSVAGTVDDTPCVDEDAIGVCTSNPDDQGLTFKIWFYGGEGEVTERLCGEFLDGTWEAFESGGGPVEPPPPTTTPQEAALAFAVSTDAVTVTPECVDDGCLDTLVEAEEGITFTPTAATPSVGFIIYPGAFVDPRAYAPVAQSIAEHGILTVIVPMPGLFAINGWDRATGIMEAHPEIDAWYLGGHSMGGAMTAHYAKLNPGVCDGLVLWAAYPGIADDLAESGERVMSIYGDRDGVATVEEVEMGVPLLPDDTQYVRIRGGNHAQFGLYGEQEGDLAAYIPAAVQWQQISGATVHFIREAAFMAPPEVDARIASAPTTDWCVQAQEVVIGAALERSAVSIDVYEDVDEFARSKPSVVAGDVGAVQLSAYVRDHGNADTPSAPPVMPREIWCKLKSQKAVTQGLGMAGDGPQAACADVNTAVLDWAKAQLSTDEIARFDAVAPEWAMAPDVPFETGLEWLIDGALTLESIEQSAGSWSIQTATLTVGDQADLPEDERLPEAYRDVVYCKLLAPAEALRWVLSLID